MKKLTMVSIISILCMMAIPIVAEEATTPDDAGEKTYTHVPFSLSFIPNVSIGGLMGGDIITNCSINIIAGRYAKLRGVEFGSVLNWETEEVFGAQFSGVANFLQNGNLTGLQMGVINYVGGDTLGVQSGVANYIGGDTLGFQSGVANFIGGNVLGVQSGVANYIGGSTLGFQSGVANYIGGSATGAQVGVANYIGGCFAGIQIGVANHVNYASSVVNKGIQIAVLNVAGDLTGAQIGVINIARKMKGTQIGVVNYADELNGAPIGIFSFVRKGQIHVDLWASEISVANVALKTGSKHVYSILAAGIHPSDPYRFSYGIGIGGHIPRGSKFVNIEVLGLQVYEDITGVDGWDNKTHTISKLRLIGGWKIKPRISVFAGLTLNVFVSDVSDGENIATASFYDSVNDTNDRWVRMWPGFVAGVQF